LFESWVCSMWWISSLKTIWDVKYENVLHLSHIYPMIYIIKQDNDIIEPKKRHIMPTLYNMFGFRALVYHIGCSSL
jgi:hypothetical protein